MALRADPARDAGLRRRGLILRAGRTYGSLTSETVTACYKPSNGTLYLVGGESRRSDCRPGDVGIAWNAGGPAGPHGPPGPAGPQGPPGEFGGELRSPNGLFSLSVTDGGIELEGPAARVALSAVGVAVQAVGPVSITGTTTSLAGTPTQLNGPCAPVLRTSDVVPGVGPDGGPVLVGPGARERPRLLSRDDGGGRAAPVAPS